MRDVEIVATCPYAYFLMCFNLRYRNVKHAVLMSFHFAAVTFLRQFTLSRVNGAKE